MVLHSTFGMWKSGSIPTFSTRGFYFSITLCHPNKENKWNTNMPSVSYRLRWGCCNIQKVSNDLNRERWTPRPLRREVLVGFVHNTRHQNIRAYGMVTIGQFYMLPSTKRHRSAPFQGVNRGSIPLGSTINSEYPVKGRGNHSSDSISEDEKFFFGKKL